MGDIQMPEQDEAYQNYVVEHVENVKKVWAAIQPLCVDEWWLDDCLWAAIDSLIKQHDRSKLDDDEYQGYRQWFFPYAGCAKRKEPFDNAWNHHQKANPHHWQYWLMWKPEETTPLSMPFPYLFEMLADWAAMSLKFNDTPAEFYKKNRGTMLLHEKTATGVGNWLPLFCESVRIIRNQTTERRD